MHVMAWAQTLVAHSVLAKKILQLWPPILLVSALPDHSRMVVARSWPSCAGPRTDRTSGWPLVSGASTEKSRQETAALCIAHLAESQWESAAG